jgi:tripartite-type tricarboxylate transporter receptor subunit TctC
LDWPSKAIRIIEPFPPGFGRDPRSRQIAEKLTGIFGQQVYVENRPGAAGRIAGQAVVSAAPDGYTFNMMGTTDLLTKYLYRLSYDLERDLVPVSMIQTVPGVILVRPSLPAKTLMEFIGLAKAHPGELTYGTTGPGSWLHVSALLFSGITGTSFRHVPYGQGSPITDIMGGHIDILFDALNPQYIENVKGQNFRILAVTGRNRVIAFPDVPTFTESGVPEYDSSAITGMFAPKGTSEPIIVKMQTAISQMLQDEALRRQWIAEGGEPIGSTPAEFRARIRSESERWGKIIRVNNIKVESL